MYKKKKYNVIEEFSTQREHVIDQLVSNGMGQLIFRKLNQLFPHDLIL